MSAQTSKNRSFQFTLLVAMVFALSIGIIAFTSKDVFFNPIKEKEKVSSPAPSASPTLVPKTAKTGK
jgi:hypothetical protein